MSGEAFLAELRRTRVLPEADGALENYALKARVLLRKGQDADVGGLLIDRLPKDDRLYLLEASDNRSCKDAAGEAIYSLWVELEHASLPEVEKTEEDEDWPSA